MKRKLFSIFAIGILAATLLCGVATGAERAPDGTGALGAPKDWTMQEIENVVEKVNKEHDEQRGESVLSSNATVRFDSEIIRVELVWYNGHRVYAVQVRQRRITSFSKLYSWVKEDTQEFYNDSYDIYYIGASNKKLYGKVSVFYTPDPDDAIPSSEFGIDIAAAKKLAIKETGGGTVVSWIKGYDTDGKQNIYHIQIINGNKKYYLSVGADNEKIYHKKQVDITLDTAAYSYSSLQPDKDEITAEQAKAKLWNRTTTDPVFEKCELAWQGEDKVWDVRAIWGKEENKVYCEAIIAADGKILLCQEWKDPLLIKYRGEPTEFPQG